MVKSNEITVSTVREKTKLKGPYWRGVIECALTGDVSRAIEICEKVCPRYEWALKRNRASLKHDISLKLDIDWIRGKSTSEALILAVMKTK